MVFVHHVWIPSPWFPNVNFIGQFGVCIFFLLSAYLIVTILLREKEATGKVRLRAFAARRILRIWPLYFLAIGLGYGLSLWYSSAYISWHALRDLLLLMGNLFVLRNGWVLGSLSPLWSISVEEQFYVAIPLLSRISARRTLAIIFMAVIALSYGVLVYLQRRGMQWSQVWANSFVQFQFFAAGGLIALWQYGRRSATPRLLRIGLLLLAAAAWSPVAHRSLATGFALVMVGTVAVFYAILDTRRRVPKALIYLGKISYGLYVFHEMFLWIIFQPGRGSSFFARHAVCGSLLALAATIAAASLSYRFFEMPFLRLKRHFETVKTRPA